MNLISLRTIKPELYGQDVAIVRADVEIRNGEVILKLCASDS